MEPAGQVPFYKAWTTSHRRSIQDIYSANTSHTLFKPKLKLKHLPFGKKEKEKKTITLTEAICNTALGKKPEGLELVLNRFLHPDLNFPICKMSLVE